LTLFQEWVEGEIKEDGGGVHLSMIYLIYYKNFCKCTTIENLNEKK
jgi:hypothetical protein